MVSAMGVWSFSLIFIHSLIQLTETLVDSLKTNIALIGSDFSLIQGQYNASNSTTKTPCPFASLRQQQHSMMQLWESGVVGNGSSHPPHGKYTRSCMWLLQCHLHVAVFVFRRCYCSTFLLLMSFFWQPRQRTNNIIHLNCEITVVTGLTHRFCHGQCWGVTENMYRRYVFKMQNIWVNVFCYSYRSTGDN